ncbi:hypothetical protein BDZ97DRAFT_270322 [Flammula alnicola]|nr:hypothetical protein BDZ97DRAFT_270322 [Flammula alnicola]
MKPKIQKMKDEYRSREEKKNQKCLRTKEPREKEGWKNIRSRPTKTRRIRRRRRRPVHRRHPTLLLQHPLLPSFLILALMVFLRIGLHIRSTFSKPIFRRVLLVVEILFAALPSRWQRPTAHDANRAPHHIRSLRCFLDKQHAIAVPAITCYKICKTSSC